MGEKFGESIVTEFQQGKGWWFQTFYLRIWNKILASDIFFTKFAKFSCHHFAYGRSYDIVFWYPIRPWLNNHIPESLRDVASKVLHIRSTGILQELWPLLSNKAASGWLLDVLLRKLVCVLARVHNICKERECPTSVCPVQTHCVKSWCNTSAYSWFFSDKIDTWWARKESVNDQRSCKIRLV